MKWIKYQIVQSTNGEETVLINKKVNYNNENLHIAEQEAYDGYEIIDDEDVEIEWLNPPMLEGVEYRTAERYNGLPVYIKRVSIAISSETDDGEMTSNGPPVRSKIVGISAIFREDDASSSTRKTVYLFSNTIGEIYIAPFMANMFGEEDYPDMNIFILNVHAKGIVEITIKYVKEE